LARDLATWEKPVSSVLFLDRSEGQKRNKKQRRVPDVNFQEVKGDKHNFVSLSGLLM
jgi:hypothetical protein